jgi:dynein heavy chain, axonemal
MSDLDLNETNRVETYKKLLFGLSMFHATILDRRRYGSIGWNIQYDFTQEDFSISKKELKLLIDQYEDNSPVFFESLYFMIGQIHYGGRVTDPID